MINILKKKKKNIRALSTEFAVSIHAIKVEESVAHSEFREKLTWPELGDPFWEPCKTNFLIFSSNIIIKIEKTIPSLYRGPSKNHFFLLFCILIVTIITKAMWAKML